MYLHREPKLSCVAKPLAAPFSRYYMPENEDKSEALPINDWL